jgi:Insertion element 4 transposase N-terminal/Transposase DDE domain
MARIYTELERFAQWPSGERIAALKQLLPRAVLREALATTPASRFCRRLPAWFLLWFVVGLGLFSRDSYRQIFRWLQPFRPSGTPGRSTLAAGRQRLGVGPVRRLLERTATLLADPATSGAFHRGYRLMGLDGFVVDLADSPRNDRVFGRPRSGRGRGAYPQARILSLCELGTHLLWRSLIKPLRRGECSMAPALLRHLDPGMLLVWDRNFFSYRLIRQVVIDRRSQLLARVQIRVVLRPIRRLSDGSYVARVYASDKHRARDRDGIEVRVIEYTLTDPGRTGHGEKHRLITTLIDETTDSATDLVVLYHERWEEELTIDELKTHQRERPVLRSQTPAGVVQEIYGLLTAHGLVRRVMMAAATRAGVAPRRVSFTGALKILRCRLPECPADEPGRVAWYDRLVAEIGEELLPNRRPRINPRVIKKKMSNWPKKRAEHRPKTVPKKRFRDTVRILD